MSEEDKVQEPQSPAVEAGNDEVSPSWKEALGSGEVKEEAAPGEESPPQEKPTYTPEELKERTGLGRKVATFEQEVMKLRQDFNQLTSVLAQRQEPYTDRAISQQDEKPPVEYITTPEDLEKHLAWRQRQEAKKRDAYANRYVHTVKNLTYLSPDMHQDIEKELLTNVNEYPTHTDFANPAFDARENYLRAENKLLKQRLVSAQVPKPNVKGGTSIPAGVSASTRMNAAPKETVKLDEHASKFIRALGESEDAEWVQKSVGRKD